MKYDSLASKRPYYTYNVYCSACVPGSEVEMHRNGYCDDPRPDQERHQSDHGSFEMPTKQKSAVEKKARIGI